VFVVEATELVEAGPGAVLDFVMDIDRYRQADHKIRRIRHVERHGDEVVVSMWTRAGGLPVPATQRMVRSGDERIDVRNEPSWQDRLVDFHGEFICQPGDGSTTRVTHRYRFSLKGPGRLAEPMIRRWLARDIVAEVRRLRAIVEGGSAAGR
jgi:hypothetical protein